jgi:repressor LexA
LHALERKGFIARDPKRARGIRVVNRSGRQLPLLGEIVAGYPLEVEVKKGNYSGLHPQALGLSDWSKTFALRVRGDSMTGRGIFDGDIVLLEHGAVPRHEDVVAALIDNESTLKTFVSKGAAAWLRAENPRYPDLIPAWGLQVQGVARAVVRLLNR